MILKDTLGYCDDIYILYTAEDFDVNKYRYTTMICKGSISDEIPRLLYKCNSKTQANENHKDILLLYSNKEICDLYNNSEVRCIYNEV